jgi:hypothetical protein
LPSGILLHAQTRITSPTTSTSPSIFATHPKCSANLHAYPGTDHRTHSRIAVDLSQPRPELRAIHVAVHGSKRVAAYEHGQPHVDITGAQRSAVGITYGHVCADDNASTQRIAVAGAQRVAVAGAQRVAVAGAQRVAVAGAQRIAVSGAQRIAVAGAQRIADSGAQRIAVCITHGHICAQRIAVAGNQRITVAGAQRIAVAGA